MKPRFVIDPTTGKISRSVGGVEYTAAALPYLTARDVMDCEVTVVTAADGVNHTEDIFTDWPIWKLGVKTAIGGTLIALSDVGALSGTGATAVVTLSLSLNTAEAIALAAGAPTGASVTVEAQLSRTVSTVEHPWTLAQQVFSLRGEIITGSEGAPVDPSAVALTSGTINGCTIGASNPSTIRGTTITATDDVIVAAGKSLRFSSTSYITPEDNIQGARIATAGGIVLAGSSVTSESDFFLRAGKSLKYSATSYISPEDNIQGARIKTNGGIVLDSGTSVMIVHSLTTNGGLQTFGANDSAGSGYRVVRVPNA